jgi:hypothetical protein
LGKAALPLPFNTINVRKCKKMHSMNYIKYSIVFPAMLLP